MTNSATSILCMLILGALALPGCKTPGPVLTLAEKTAINAGVISGQLKRLSSESRSVAELRAANVAQLYAANAVRRANYEFDLALTRKSGGGKNLELITMIEKWRAQVREIYSKNLVDEGVRKKQILAGQTKLNAKSKELAEIAKALAAISKQDSTKDRLKFFAGYAKELKSEVDEKLEESNRSAESARGLIAKLKPSEPAGAAQDSPNPK